MSKSQPSFFLSYVFCLSTSLLLFSFSFFLCAFPEVKIRFLTDIPTLFAKDVTKVKGHYWADKFRQMERKEFEKKDWKKRDWRIVKQPYSSPLWSCFRSFNGNLYPMVPIFRNSFPIFLSF